MNEGETSEERTHTAPNGTSGQLDILIVDDDRLVLDVVSEIITASGHHARIASSGGEALNLLSERHCDLVISDVRMPGMDGFELAGHIRTQYPDVRLVLMTGYSSDSTFREAMKLDVDAYLSKPFKAADLARILNSIHDSGTQNE